MQERKPYARYFYNRGLQTFWKGDAAKPGSHFRSVAIAADNFNSTVGTFQVYALEGIGRGIENGRFAGSEDNPRVIFDEDFQGLDRAARKFKELVEGAQSNGFEPITFMDMLEFEDKLRASRTS
jgi:hypothetical protein